MSFIITDARAPEPIVLEFSPGAEKIFGYSKTEMVGKPVSILHLPNEVTKFPEAHKRMREGKTGFSGSPGTEDANVISYSTHNTGTEHGYEADWTTASTSIGTNTDYVGFLSDINITGAGGSSTGVDIRSFYSDVDIDATVAGLSIDNLSGFWWDVTIDTDTSVDNLYGLAINPNLAAGSVTNAYGVWIGQLQNATNAWGVYQPISTMDNYFNGNVGIKDSTPSYPLDSNGDINVQTGSVYRHNGSAGLSGTYTFGGGSSGDIASMTFAGGILTGVTLVP